MLKVSDDSMNEKEMVKATIERYVDLQRIKHSQNRDAEIKLQENILESQLSSLGITDLNKFKIED